MLTNGRISTTDLLYPLLCLYRDWLDMKPTVLMVELKSGKWRIVVAATGHIILDDIKLRDHFSAYDYVKNWVTSFGAWSFEVVRLDKQ